MQIEIRVCNDDGDLLAKRTSGSFEGAEEDLGKLESYIEVEEQKLIDLQKYGETNKED